MHGTFKTRRKTRRTRKVSDAELVARRAYYLAHNAKLRTFLEQPRATEADKAVRKDNERTKELVNMARTRWPTIIEEKIDRTVPAVASDGLPPWDRPRFDAYQFARYELQYRGEIPDGIIITVVTRTPVQDRFPWLPGHKKIKPTSRGEKLTATWEGGNLAEPKVSKGGISHEALLAKARQPIQLVEATGHERVSRPTKVVRRDGSVIIRNVPHVRHDGRLLPRRHVIKHSNRAWFGNDYAKRWNQAAPSYVDIRIAGKVRRVIDGTWHAADEATDYISTQRQSPPQRRQRIPRLIRASQTLRGVVWTILILTHLDWSQVSPWLFAMWVARKLHPATPPMRSHTAGLAREISEIETTFTLDTWTPNEAKKRNRKKRPTPRQPGFLAAHEELELARRGKAGEIRARDEIISRHWQLVQRKCRHVSVADQADAIAVGTARLQKAWDDWDPERGVRFGAFAAQAVEWAIQDFMDQQRRQVPVAQSINANIPVLDNKDTERAEKMMRNNSTETQVSIARRRLVAERAPVYLDQREQYVIEARLGLNGYQPLEQEQIAEQLGMSVRHIRRIEKEAIGKLQQAVA
jgi:RNA polymerase sigma factor (sigma-70 family)